MKSCLPASLARAFSTGMSKKVVAYVDGASRGNPGPASVGVVLQDETGKTIKTLAVKIGTATNNTAEYFALIFALQQAMIMRVDELQVYTDSELVAKQFSGEYKIKEPTIQQYFLFVQHLKSGFKKLAVSHVPREKNKLADEAANQALDNNFLQIG